MTMSLLSRYRQAESAMLNSLEMLPIPRRGQPECVTSPARIRRIVATAPGGPRLVAKG